MEDGWHGRCKRRGKFVPKDRSTLRPCMKPLIGRVFDFTYAGHSGDNEKFPGQSRWLMDRRHDAELTPEQIGRWFPDEDIQDVETNQ